MPPCKLYQKKGKKKANKFAYVKYLSYVCPVIDTYAMRLINIFALTILTSCEPYLCEDCYNVTQNGEVTYICVEYDCSREPQFNLDLMKQEFESAAKPLPTTPLDRDWETL